jgi:hypothetical protein
MRLTLILYTVILFFISSYAYAKPVKLCNCALYDPVKSGTIDTEDNHDSPNRVISRSQTYTLECPAGKIAVGVVKVNSDIDYYRRSVRGNDEIYYDSYGQKLSVITKIKCCEICE